MISRAKQSTFCRKRTKKREIPFLLSTTSPKLWLSNRANISFVSCLTMSLKAIERYSITRLLQWNIYKHRLNKWAGGESKEIGIIGTCLLQNSFPRLHECRTRFPCLVHTFPLFFWPVIANRHRFRADSNNNRRKIHGGAYRVFFLSFLANDACAFCNRPRVL